MGEAGARDERGGRVGDLTGVRVEAGPEGDRARQGGRRRDAGTALPATLGATEMEGSGVAVGLGDGVSTATLAAGGRSPAKKRPSPIASTIAPRMAPIEMSEA